MVDLGEFGNRRKHREFGTLGFMSKAYKTYQSDISRAAVLVKWMILISLVDLARICT